jgi:biotin carboxyl carrier protein
MKLHAEVSDEKLEVDVRRDGRTVFARVDDREYELEVSTPEPGVYLFKYKGQVKEAFVFPAESPSGSAQVQLGSSTFDITIIDPRRLRGSQSGADHGAGAAEIRAAMPGKVVRVLLEPGAEVAKGDGVLVVEAMKMQNELKAPKAGMVKEILVAEGATVAAGDVLATIE